MKDSRILTVHEVLKAIPWWGKRNEYWGRGGSPGAWAPPQLGYAAPSVDIAVGSPRALKPSFLNDFRGTSMFEMVLFAIRLGSPGLPQVICVLPRWGRLNASPMGNTQGAE